MPDYILVAYSGALDPVDVAHRIEVMARGTAQAAVCEVAKTEDLLVGLDGRVPIGVSTTPQAIVRLFGPDAIYPRARY